MITIGCDPGLKGGFAVFRDRTLVSLHDMPVIRIPKKVKGSDIRDIIGGAKTRSEGLVVGAEVAALFRKAIDGAEARLILEDCGGIPGQGADRSYNFGVSTGIVRGVAETLGIPVILAHPSTWKAKFGLNSKKAPSIEFARQLWPEMKAQLRNDGRAEAALIGWYGLGG